MNSMEKKWKEITDMSEKKAYLEKNWSGVDFNDEKTCIHCDEIIKVSEFKIEIQNDFEYICCPNAPRCNGTAIDWFPISNVSNKPEEDSLFDSL